MIKFLKNYNDVLLGLYVIFAGFSGPFLESSFSQQNIDFDGIIGESGQSNFE